MEQAIEAVKRKNAPLSINKASKTFKVPVSSLFRNVKYPERNKKLGRSTVLSQTDEDHLGNWIIRMQKMGFSISKSELFASAVKINMKLGSITTIKPTCNWLTGFMKRHSEISLRSAKVKNVTASVTRESLQLWFENMRIYFGENHLMEVMQDPTRVFNSVEAAFVLNTTPCEEAILRKGCKSFYTKVATIGKDCVSVLITGNANGTMAPRCVVFDYKRVPRQLMEDMPHDWSVACSDSGWMTSQTFYEYITNVFHPWLLRNHITLPVIVFVDWHASHQSFHLSEFCDSNGIVLVALQPDVKSHLIQPIEMSVFRALEQLWKEDVLTFRNTYHQGLQKKDFAKVFQNCLAKISESTLANGFRQSGLFPFNCTNVDFDKVVYNNEQRAAKRRKQ